MPVMTQEQLRNCKRIVIKAFVDHELGNPLEISDKVYDDYLAKIKEADPDFNVYEFTKFFADENGYIAHRAGMEDLSKEYIHEIDKEWVYEDKHHKLPKYDGSSIVIYYTAGKLSHILSMRDKDSGIDQTDKFRSFVPEKVDAGISYIRCECVVDVSLDDNPRGKANGLVNSKYLQEEVEEKCTLMAFCCHDLNGKMMPWSEFVKLDQYNSYRENGIPRFMRSPEIQEFTLVDGVAIYESSKANFKVAVDGIVYYGEGRAKKYDYINSQISTVLDINWAETDRECFFPTVSIDPVELEGTIVKNPSSNGVRNIISMGIAIGCRVEVIKSGMTIPKIIRVLDPAEAQLPTCPHCGYQMTEDDIFGNGLKCGNPNCEGKYNTRKNSFNTWIETDGVEGVKEQMDENPEENFFWFLNVSRFNYETARYGGKEEVSVALLSYLMNDDYKSFEEWIGNTYYWTDLQWSEAVLNLPTTFKVFREFYSNS